MKIKVEYEDEEETNCRINLKFRLKKYDQVEKNSKNVP